MIKITISGEARTDYPNLQELHGIDCQDVFSDYFDNDASFADEQLSILNLNIDILKSSNI